MQNLRIFEEAIFMLVKFVTRTLKLSLTFTVLTHDNKGIWKKKIKKIVRLLLSNFSYFHIVVSVVTVK